MCYAQGGEGHGDGEGKTVDLVGKGSPPSTIAGAGVWTPPRSPGSPEVDALREQVADLEKKFAAVAKSPQQVTKDDLKEAMQESRQNKSSIQIRPQVQWPVLGDTEGEGETVDKFFEALEEIFDLDNGGQGMLPVDRLVCLKSALNGSKKQIYDNIVAQLSLEKIPTVS